jgi:hypothetical protein
MGKYKFYILGGIFLILAGYLIFGAFKSPENKSEISQLSTPENQPTQNFQASLDGELVSLEIAQSRPMAIMVENYPEARPQSGLVDADVVYEAPTEGGVTRYLAVYQSKAAKNIGPVRSVRTYFAEIADELSAILAHVGGNSDALENIKQNKYPHLSDADQFFNDPYFQRVSWRQMPHNVYTSVAGLKKLMAAHKFPSAANVEPWIFSDEVKPAPASAASITVPFSEAVYEVKWRYDAQSKSYKRFLANQPHKDLDTKKQIAAKTVIVQIVETFPVKSDTPLSIGMTLTGQGKTYVFQEGGVVVGVWKKSGSGRTRYYDKQNREISFGRGLMWVELLPQEQAPGLVWK